MSRLANSDDWSATLRYFVEEQIVASPLLVLILVVLAFIGSGDVMTGFREGLTTFITTPAGYLRRTRRALLCGALRLHDADLSRSS